MMFLDTSGLLALILAREPLHQKACDEYARASTRVTHGFVLAELVALTNARGVPSGPVLQFLMSLIANPDITVMWPDEAVSGQAITLLIARQGRGYSLCDAVSFIIMRGRNIGDALSTDKHFEDEGFRRLLV
jgi:predicted nucleic acid-binding protein